MKLGDVASTILAICAVVGLIGGIVIWFFKRGGSEREMTLALEQNTDATRELTKSFSSFRAEVVKDLHSLDVRMTKVEAHIDGNTAHRNPSPAGGH